MALSESGGTIRRRTANLQNLRRYESSNQTSQIREPLSKMCAQFYWYSLRKIIVGRWESRAIKNIKIWIISVLLIIILFPLVYLIVNMIQISQSTLSSEVGLIIHKPDRAFSFFKIVRNSDNKSMNFEDMVLLNDLYNKISKKSLRRIPGKDGNHITHEATYYLEYNGGKEIFLIDKHGRILVTKDKGDIRNMSRLHWIWWKIDSITDKYTGLYYITEPDSKVIEYVDKKIFEKG